MAEQVNLDDSSTQRLSASAALAGWASAVRAKADWHRKILDEQRGLCAKWVAEGDLGRFQVEPADIDSLVRELKAEATRALAFDQLSFLASGGQPNDKTSFSQLAAAETERIKTDVYQALGRAPELIKTPTLRDNLGVRTADGLVPKSLHSLLVSELEKIQQQSPVSDYHPGSNGKVLDIIHPSLYPYVAGRTRLVTGAGPLGDLFETHTELQLYDEWDELECNVAHKSRFAWLPSVFRISKEGEASIIGYINGLGPRSDHPALYAALENVFTLALPLIEQSLNAPFERVFTESYQRWRERRDFLCDPERYKGDGLKPQEWIDFLAKQKVKQAEGYYSRKLDEKQPQWDTEMRKPINVKGRDIKVIVKVAEYHLNPGQTYEGSWHIEGAPHEMIGSSLIYYYETSPEIEDKGLNLRRVRIEGDKPDTAQEHGSEDYGVYFDSDDEDNADWDISSQNVPSDWGSDFDPYSFGGSVPLGTIGTTGGPNETETGKMLAFPNWVQHQVAGLKNTIKAKEGSPASCEVAKRKILCFFVVREDRDIGNKDQLTLPGVTYTGLEMIPPVITTRQVPPQQHYLAFPSFAYWLARACETLTGTALPIELCHQIFLESGTGLSRSEAELIRREVMDDRGKLTKAEGEFWEMSDFGLCEH